MTNTTDNIALVLDELDNAKRKHPHFVDRFIKCTESVADMLLTEARTALGHAKDCKLVDFRHVLGCECYEAFQAYAHGDLAHARQELAQCAAICIRGIEYVQSEIDKQNTKQPTTTQGETTP